MGPACFLLRFFLSASDTPCWLGLLSVLGAGLGLSAGGGGGVGFGRSNLFVSILPNIFKPLNSGVSALIILSSTTGSSTAVTTGASLGVSTGISGFFSSTGFGISFDSTGGTTSFGFGLSRAIFPTTLGPFRMIWLHSLVKNFFFGLYAIGTHQQLISLFLDLNRTLKLF